MPESDCGFDKQVYGLLTQYIVPFFCKYNIHPNFVTMSNILLTFVIYYIIINEKVNKYWILLLMMLYALLDCFDGAIARKCNKESTFGAKLDIFSDQLHMFMHLYVLLGHYYKPSLQFNLLFFSLFLLTYLITITKNINSYKICKMISDNYFLSYFIIWIVLYSKMIFVHK